MTSVSEQLRAQFGEIDVYLFDQLLRGRVAEGARILDAGCGSGRNLVFLMRAGFDVWGVDADPDAIMHVRQVAAHLAPGLDAEHFRAEPVEAMTQRDSTIDFVISSAVLHFARDEAHWMAMVREMWRVLAPGGVLFARLATTVGQSSLQRLGRGRYVMPDGDVRYLVDHELLHDVTNRLGGTLLDPLKSTVVHNRRSMGTWVVRKSRS